MCRAKYNKKNIAKDSIINRLTGFLELEAADVFLLGDEDY